MKARWLKALKNQTWREHGTQLSALVAAASWATVGVGVYLLLPPPSDKK